MIYLTSRDGRCGIVNRDVVKLQVDLHCEKKPPCFPFPVKPKQKRDVWGVFSGTNTPERSEWLQVAAEVIEEVVNDQRLVFPGAFHFPNFPQLCFCLHLIQAPHLKK